MPAGVAAAATGVAMLAAGLFAGYELYERLLRGSLPALGLLLALGTVVGAYGGWLLGLVVFAAVRGSAEEGLPSRTD